MTDGSPEKNYAIVPMQPMPLDLLKKWEDGIILPPDVHATHCYEPQCADSAEYVVGLLLPHQWFYPGRDVALMPVIYVACSTHKAVIERIQRSSFPKAPLLQVADVALESKRYVLETLQLVAANQPDLHLVFDS